MDHLKAPTFDLELSLENNILIFKSCGLWTPENASKFKTDLYTTYALCFSLFIVCPYLLSQIVNVFMVIDDLEEFTESTFVLMTILSAATKALTIQIMQKRIKKIVHQLNSDLFQPKLSEHRTILVKATDEIRFLFRLLGFIYAFSILLLCIFPFFDDSKKRALPIKAWFPYSLEVSPTYELTYLHQVVATVFTASLNCALDTFVVSLVVHSIAQLDILLSNLSMGHSGYWKHAEADSEVKDKMLYLKRCAIHHEVIVKYVEEIESLFNFSVLVQFSFSGVIICITLFQMTVVQPFSVQFLSIIEYQVCMLVELFLYCWYGNELYLRLDIFQSMMISEAAYFSDWYEQGIVYCQSLQIIMVRATMPIQIRAGYFFALSLETFTTILRSAWSFFALLQQVHSENID